MNNAENAFNSIYPTVLRIVALNRRIKDAGIRSDAQLQDQLADEIQDSINDLTIKVEGIEAGTIDDSLTTSMAAVLNQMRRRSKHN